MDFTTFHTDLADGVLTVTLSRPERHNTFTITMCLELARLFDWTDADDQVRAVVITGEGLTFCAGADLEERFVSAGEAITPTVQEYLDVVGQVDGVPRDGGGWVTLRMARSLKPVIVAFNGSAIGVGVTLTLPADIRIASESARFALSFARRGLVPEAASSWFLPRVVGIARASEWVLTGRTFDAHEALAGGLISRVVPHAELVASAQQVAKEITSNSSPVAVAASRRMLWSMLGSTSPWEAHAVDSHGIFELASAADCREGIAAFLEKRDADFPLTVSADLPDFVPDWPARPPHLSREK